jgi:hypothetical protein
MREKTVNSPTGSGGQRLYDGWLEYFTPDQVETEDGLRRALDILEGSIDPYTTRSILSSALERPNLLEFILSST